MTTMLDIVTRAFRKVGIASDDETLTADQAASGNASLNMMLHGFANMGADLAHSDRVLTQDFPLDPRFEEGCVYMLAVRLGHDYTIPPSFNEDRFRRELQAAYMQIGPSTVPRSLQRLPSAYARPMRARGFGL